MSATAKPQKVSPHQREGAIHKARQLEQKKRTDLRSRVEFAIVKTKAICFAKYGPRRAQSLWQWSSRVGHWQKFGKFCFESHATLGEELGRTKRCSQEQKAFVEELGIIEVKYRYQRCEKPDEHHRGCLCNRDPKNRTRRSNDTRLRLDAIDKLYNEVVSSAERAEIEQRYKDALVVESDDDGGDVDELDEETRARFELRDRVVAYIARFSEIAQFATNGNANILLDLAKSVGKPMEQLEADVQRAVLINNHGDDVWGWVKRYVAAETPAPASEPRAREEEAKPFGAAQMKAETAEPRDANPKVLADLRLPFTPEPLSAEEFAKRARDRNRAPP